jgi:predicted transcriptional regulator
MKVLTDTKNIQCDDAVKCLFNLNNLDIIIYKTLQKTGEIRADELASLINRERSTVYRSLQKLIKCRMCLKKTKHLQRGGYYHVYECSNNKNIKKHAKKCLDEWYLSLKKTIEKFEK